MRREWGQECYRTRKLLLMNRFDEVPFFGINNNMKFSEFYCVIPYNYFHIQIHSWNNWLTSIEKFSWGKLHGRRGNEIVILYLFRFSSYRGWNLLVLVIALNQLELTKKCDFLFGEGGEDRRNFKIWRILLLVANVTYCPYYEHNTKETRVSTAVIELLINVG